uniref:Capsid protein n=1 Tax=Caloscypha fulgens partitivirus 2 TaxID=2778760 RepID=A0A7L8Y8Q7_9VIRU|nr:capsid protein [Caloscypha fulgens partitivirus 2]
MASRTRTTIPAPPLPVPIETAHDTSSSAPSSALPSVLDRLDPSRNTQTNNGSLTIIDPLPDFRFPLLSWLFSITHGVQNTAYLSSPVASPASLLGYTTIMYYAMLFHNDAFLRPAPSPAAYSILNDAAQSDLFNLMLDMLVPSFAVNEFESIRPHFDDLATNLCLFPSLAGSNFLLDFGRYFPANTFFVLHNLMASLPTNTNYETLAITFYSATVAQLQIGTTDFNLTPAHLFGAAIRDHNSTTRYTNWLNHRIDALVASSAIRVINAMATVTRLPLVSPPRTTIENYNPYSFGIGYTYENSINLRELIRGMNFFVQSTFPTSRPLRAYTQLGTNAITRHLSFDSVCPTWHTNTAPDSTQFGTTFGPQSVPSSHAEFATAISYLVARPDFTDANDRDAQLLSPGRDLATPSPGSRRVDLVNPAPTTPSQDPTPWRLFDSPRHITPNCLIFDPQSGTTAHLTSVITAGIIIESNDLSQIGLNLPSTALPLGDQNSRFIQGAIPYALIRPGTTNAPFFARRRQFNERPRLAQSFMRSTPSHLLLPFFRQGLIQRGPDSSRATTGSSWRTRLFPGALFNDHVRRPSDCINFFSAPLGTIRLELPTESIPLWSSYRYYDNESRTWYMLPSLLHIYGARSRFSGTTHPWRIRIDSRLFQVLQR